MVKGIPMEMHGFKLNERRNIFHKNGSFFNCLNARTDP